MSLLRRLPNVLIRASSKCKSCVALGNSTAASSAWALKHLETTRIQSKQFDENMHVCISQHENLLEEDSSK